MANIEELAVAALHAWNGVLGGLSWPKDFPEGSRAAWRRVVTAILEQTAAAQTGVKLGDVPLSTGNGQGKAPEISADLGSRPQQTPSMAPDLEEENQALRECHREAAEMRDRLKGLLRSAVRYVHGYNENLNNHPQARDAARSLIADINSALT